MRRAPKNRLHALSCLFSFVPFFLTFCFSFLLTLAFFFFVFSRILYFISPAVKAKRNAVNLSYNVGRGKLDYPSLFSLFLILSPLRYTFRSSFRLWFVTIYRLQLDTWNFSTFPSIVQRDRQETRPAQGLEFLLSFSFFLFFFFFAVVHFKGQEEGRIENVGLYAFFTRNQEPRPCPGVGLTGDAHGYSYEIVCPVVSYRVVFLRVCKRCL